jgi:hypothetical protein
VYRLVVDFDIDADEIPWVESLLRAVLPQAAERVGGRLDHFRIDLIPQEDPQP